MAQPGKQGMSDAQKSELWRRRRHGESINDISRAIGKVRTSVFSVLKAHGGFPPPLRRRASSALTLAEREEISRGIAAGHSMREIAKALQRSPSTISHEIARNDETLRVSHETIYKSIFIQARGVLKKELQQHLRSQRTFRKPRYSSLRGMQRGQIVDGISIADQPPEVEDRAVPGRWEGDLIAGFANSYIATLDERHSRFTMLVKVNGKDTHTVVTALSKQVRKLPDQLRKSLNWDRGMKLANHKAYTLATDTQVYFCDPRSPWQRGTNENTNRLLRQYFPKGTAISIYSQSELNKVARRLNQRPRKTLGYETPADKLQASVASTD